MSTSLFKNAVITFATGSSALIFCSYTYQDGFFSSFGIRIERYLDGLPEPIMLSMPMIEAIVMLGILGFIGVFYLLYFIKDKKQNDYKAVNETALGIFVYQTYTCARSGNFLKQVYGKKPPIKELVTIGILTSLMLAAEVIEYLYHSLVLLITLLQAALSLAIIVVFVVILKNHEDEFLHRRRYATFLRSWFPVAVVLVIFLLLGSSLKGLGRHEAAIARRNKTQVTLSQNDHKIELDSGTYYIRHTKQWIFFYNETEGNIIYPISKVSSIRFKGRQQRPI